MEEEKGGANNVSTRSKRITKDNKAPAVRGGRKGGDEDAEESQVSSLSCQIQFLIWLFHFRAKEKIKESAQKKDPSRRSSKKSVCGDGSIMECCAKATSSGTRSKTQPRK